ncbi:hypothetical protein H8356DRAFT_955033 [Neocallimastix lanati (nom. inval.)]|uniref:Uncharacterized protein n=1 Tax=Neocallimastix californiae TaxID=1754190 RepID=A0A1Y2EHD2_9FUNG|nr:hypothetical protein H8356DRAFT_955033 [Neocallimastix sp. JGI-2020a]ORY70676.1 hypothetical protein LY90DRAFT_204114 [Neocallimastix californiae]|eukprot:ORY70676.1 hypothetical protein LY90DRAFT_204114 [Neocallimastix californiae]
MSLSFFIINFNTNIIIFLCKNFNNNNKIYKFTCCFIALRIIFVLSFTIIPPNSSIHHIPQSLRLKVPTSKCHSPESFTSITV